MSKKRDARIEIHSQLSAFYSKVFSMDKPFTTQHISLYVFLLNQNNRSYWAEWFKLPFDLAMQGAAIGSKNTYYKCLNDLSTWGFIEYQKGENSWKAPKIKLIVLRYKSEPQSEPQVVPLCEPVKPNSSELRYKSEPQVVPLLGTQQGTYIIHNNLLLLNKYLSEKFSKELSEMNFALESDIEIFLNSIKKEKKEKKNLPAAAPEYQECLAAYFSFFEKQTGVKPDFKIQDGAALKKLIKYFEKNKRPEETILRCFVSMFENWNKLSAFDQKQIDLTKIHGNINSIVFQIKNGIKPNNGQAKSDYEKRINSGTVELAEERNRKYLEEQAKAAAV